MRYLSVCSGIGSDAVAWHLLGWETAAFAEIDKQASAVLAHRFPGIPNAGDFTTIGGLEHGSIDLLAGGTPCQSFSVAGLRGGLDDGRGNLALEFCRLAGRVLPRWVVWENVPGVLSLDEGRAFGSIVGALVELGYGLAWRILDAQYVRVESHPRAVPQRRRRLFLVGYLGDWRPPTAVLLEPESLQGDRPPRRGAGEDVAGVLSASLGRRGGHPSQAGDQPLIAGSVSAKWGKGTGGPAGDECYNLVAFDTTQITHPANRTNQNGTGWRQDGSAFTLDTKGDQGVATLEVRGRGDGRNLEMRADGTANALRTPNGGRDGMGVGAIHTGTTVRRLTPLECERLMGLPDNWTAVPYRGKPMADGPRYRMIGNGITINCLHWIGARIGLFDALKREDTA